MQVDLNNNLLAPDTALQRRRGSPKGSSTSLRSLRLSAGEAACVSADCAGPPGAAGRCHPICPAVSLPGSPQQACFGALAPPECSSKLGLLCPCVRLRCYSLVLC